MWLWIAVAVLVLVLVWAVWTFNRLITFRNRVDEGWSQIDVQLRRRYDLIPNLVEVVRGYADHERATFERVTAARTAAIDASGVAGQADAETAVTAGLRQLLGVVEAYPELKADRSFLALQEELTGDRVEDRLRPPVLQRPGPRSEHPHPAVPLAPGRASGRDRRARVLRDRRSRGPRPGPGRARGARGLMHEQIAANQRKTVLLFVVGILFLVAIGAVVGYLFGAGPYGAVVALVIAAVLSLLSWYSGDKLVLASTRAKEVSVQDQPRLHNLVEGLAIAGGIPKPRIYVVPEGAPNAYATGRDPEHSSIAVTQGLLDVAEPRRARGRRSPTRWRTSRTATSSWARWSRRSSAPRSCCRSS